MIEISLKYHPLFKLDVRHSYYSKGSSMDLKLVPSHDSIKTAKRLGLILKESGGEFFLLHEQDKLEGLRNETQKEHQPLKFSFYLYASNPYFINFTDLPIENSSELFYFSNAVQKAEGDIHFLHQKDFVDKADKYPILRSLELTTENRKVIEIKDGFGNSIIKRELLPEEKIVLSNQHLPVGKYELWEDGVLINTFILFSDMPVFKPIGIVDIFFSGSMKEGILNAMDVWDIPFNRYAVSFSTRQTFWKYLVVGKYNANLQNTTIEGRERECAFKGPEEVKMKNGQNAFMFISENPLPLKQLYDFSFQLKSLKNGFSNGKILLDNLPLASPELVQPESRDEDSKIFSEIIVHI